MCTITPQRGPAGLVQLELCTPRIRELLGLHQPLTGPVYGAAALLIGEEPATVPAFGPVLTGLIPRRSTPALRLIT